MATKIKVLAWLTAATHAITLVIGMVLFLSAGAVATFVGRDGLALSGILLAAGILALLMTVPGAVVAWGLTRRRAWSRGLGLVMSFLMLLTPNPFNIAVAFYGFYVLLQPEAEEYLVL